MVAAGSELISSDVVGSDAESFLRRSSSACLRAASCEPASEADAAGCDMLERFPSVATGAASVVWASEGFGMRGTSKEPTPTRAIAPIGSAEYPRSDLILYRSPVCPLSSIRQQSEVLHIENRARRSLGVASAATTGRQPKNRSGAIRVLSSMVNAPYPVIKWLSAWLSITLLQSGGSLQLEAVGNGRKLYCWSYGYKPAPFREEQVCPK